MAPHKEWYSSYEEFDCGEVYFRDNSSYLIIGQGKVKLSFNDGRIKNLLGVLYNPRLARNLILNIKVKLFGSACYI